MAATRAWFVGPWFWCGVVLATWLGVFLLPFAFPPPLPTFSSSYTYGFSNRIAGMAAMAIGTAVLAMLALRNRQSIAEPLRYEPLPTRWLSYAMVAAAAFTAWFGGHWIHSNVFYDDGSYVLMQLNRGVRDGATLYRDFEWPYGPLLYYWPAWTQRLLGHFHVSAGAAYVVTLAVMQVIGISMLAYVLSRLPITRGLRGCMLLLCTYGTLTPILGINYTLLRFLLPHTLLLAGVRCRSVWAQTAAFAVGTVVALSISPELGIALLAGLCAYGGYRAWHDGAAWLMLPSVSFLSAAAFFTAVSRDLLFVLKNMSAGGLNMLVQAEFHIVVLLVAAVALAPLAVAPYLRRPGVNGRKDAATMLAFYMCSLVMLGPALGRCDPLHTFFGGLGVFILSLVSITRLLAEPRRRVWRYAWLGLLGVTIHLHQVDKLTRNAAQIPWLLREPCKDDGVDFAKLRQLTGGGRVAIPVQVPQRVSEALFHLGELQPSYSVYMRGAWDAASVQRKIADMRTAPYLLIPDWAFNHEYEQPDTRTWIRLLQLHRSERRQQLAYVPGEQIVIELRSHWKKLGSVGQYSVYQQAS